MSEKRPHILICRLSHIGDCVLTLPMALQLRRGFPAARICWAMESPTDQLLADHPAIDEILLIPRKWLKSPSAILETRRRLAERRFDIAVDPQSILKSALLARLSGARTRLGFAGVHGREKSHWLNNCRVVPQSSHLVDRSLELIQPLIGSFGFPGFRLPVPAVAAASTQQFLDQQGISGPFAVINPGASWPSKRWETDRFADVARALSEQPGIASVITWAGDEEKRMAEQIVQRAAGSARMAPATRLPELAALLARAAIFVGCDTGPLHIAAAAGTVCVGLYGPTRPGDSGAYGAVHVAIQARYQAGSCRQRRAAPNDAMRDIHVPEVIAGCRLALGRAAGGATQEAA